MDLTKKAWKYRQTKWRGLIMENKIKELENKIVIEKGKYEEYISKSEPVKNKCIELIINYIQREIKKETEYLVKKDVDNTNNLGLSKLSELKKEMNSLIYNVNKLKDLIYNDYNIWKISEEFMNTIDFTTGDNFGKRYNNEKDINSRIVEIVRKEFSKIGEVLYKFNYIKEDNFKHGWKKIMETIEYEYAISLDGELNDVVKLYTEMFSDYFKANESIFKLEKELKETRAMFLWEQA